MKLKYSGMEVQNKLDAVEYKLNQRDVVDSCPTELKPLFGRYNIFNANTIVKLINQIKNFKLQNPESFIDFVENIQGINLLSDEDSEKLSKLSSSFVGVFSTILDIPNIYKDSSVAIVQHGEFNKPELVFKSANRWFYLNGSQLSFSLSKYDDVLVGHNVIAPYNIAKVHIYAETDADNVHIIELNLLKSNKQWWMQIIRDTKLETQDKLIDLKMNISQELYKYPELIVKALETTNVKIRLDVVM